MDLKNSAVNRHKTKLLGIATIVLGFLQTDQSLKALLPEQVYAWLMVAVGLGTLVCGFLNTFEGTAPTANKQAGFVNLPMLLVLLTFVSVIAACTGTRAAYDEASSADEHAYVAVEHYAALVKEAADLKEQPGTSQAAITAMQEADLAAQPVVNRVRELRDTYQKLRDAETELELQEAVNEAILLIADLVRAVKQARGESL